MKPTPYPLVIGEESTRGGKCFGGQMAQLSIWDKELTAQQIDEYKSSWLLHRPQGLLLYYPAIDTGIQICQDFSGNKLHGSRTKNRSEVRMQVVFFKWIGNYAIAF